MTAIVLTRIDPAKNMCRFYKLDIQPTLFDEWALVREWGRIGRGGTVRCTAFGTAQEAQTACDRQREKKQRRGYTSKNAASTPFI